MVSVELPYHLLHYPPPSELGEALNQQLRLVKDRLTYCPIQKGSRDWSRNGDGSRLTLIHINGLEPLAEVGETRKLKKKMHLLNGSENRTWRGKSSGRCFGRSSTRTLRRRAYRCGCCAGVKSA
jgi:hypothetical protein